MPPSLPSPLRIPALLAVALLCAALANGLAGPERRLTWTGWQAPMNAALPARPVAPAPEPAGAAAPARPAPRPAIPKSPPAAANRFAPDPAAVIREIDSADALAAFQLKAPFLDARRSAEFAAGHVPGAWSVPVWEAAVDARITEFEARANPAPKAPIVIYCAGGGCVDSQLLARKLEALGYRNLLIYRDGFPDWQGQARPVVTGTRP
jgi:rhodanese-related sulfurtransferase